MQASQSGWSHGLARIGLLVTAATVLLVMVWLERFRSGERSAPAGHQAGDATKRRIVSAFAIFWLIAAGSLVAATGTVMVWAEVMRTDSCIGIECGLRQLFAFIDLVGIAFGAAYLAAGVGLWQARPRARLAGVSLALVGFLLVPLFLGIMLPTSLGWAMSETAYVGLPEWPGIMALIANGVALVGLIAWEPAARRAAARPPS